MMLMVGMLSTTGFIEWVGVQSVVLCKGRPWRLVLVLGAVSWVMGALMDCVTTMCVVVPIALSSLRMVGVEDKSVGSIIIAMAIFGNVRRCCDGGLIGCVRGEGERERNHARSAFSNNR